MPGDFCVTRTSNHFGVHLGFAPPCSPISESNTIRTRHQSRSIYLTVKQSEDQRPFRVIRWLRTDVLYSPLPFIAEKIEA